MPDKRHYMNLAHTIGTGVAWLFSASVLTRLLGLAYTFVVIRTLSPYEYGLVELVLSLPMLLSIAALPGVETTLIADMGVEKGKRNFRRARFLFESYIATRLVLAAAAWALLFFSAPLLAQWYNAHIAAMVRLVSFIFLSGVVRMAVTIALRVSLSFRALAAHNILEEVAKLGLLIVFLALIDTPPVAVVAAYVLSEWAVSLGFVPLALYRAKELFSGAPASGGWFALFHLLKAHGKWSVFSTYLGQFQSAARLWAIKFFIGTDAVGIFAVAHGMFQQVTALLPIARVVDPLVAQYLHRRETMVRLLQKSVKYQVIGYAIAAPVASILLPVILLPFFPHYAAAFALFPFLTLAYLPGAVGSGLRSAFFALKMQRSLFFAVLKMTVLSLLSLPLLLPLFGLYGAALEFILTRAVFAFDRYRILRKVLPEFSLAARDLVSLDRDDRRLLKAAARRIPFARVILARLL